jgi:hypothetical protein
MIPYDPVLSTYFLRVATGLLIVDSIRTHRISNWEKGVYYPIIILISVIIGFLVDT